MYENLLNPEFKDYINEVKKFLTDLRKKDVSPDGAKTEDLQYLPQITGKELEILFQELINIYLTQKATTQAFEEVISMKSGQVREK